MLIADVSSVKIGLLQTDLLLIKICKINIGARQIWRSTKEIN